MLIKSRTHKLEPSKPYIEGEHIRATDQLEAVEEQCRFEFLVVEQKLTRIVRLVSTIHLPPYWPRRSPFELLFMFRGLGRKG